MFDSLSKFYTSKEWTEFRALIIQQRTRSDGFVYDEITGKPIVKAYDIIAHHIVPLTLDNVNDFTISLNPDNIQLVSFKTHNEIHERFGTWTRHIYLVYGSPLSGKASFVKERAGVHDLIVDIDKIYECITNLPKYTKSNRVYPNVQAVRDSLLETIKFKRGKWVNAWIVSGMPYKGERERFCIEYNAEPILIECTKEEALLRLESNPNGRDIREYSKHIETWFNRFQN